MKKKAQNEYDDKTVHGIIKEGQREWQKKIKVELEELKEFASTVEDCE